MFDTEQFQNAERKNFGSQNRGIYNRDPDVT